MLCQSLFLFFFFNSPFAVARLFHSLPDDLYAFPKYRVTFLNGLPLLNETAERWLREGLRGGEAEFLDHPTPWEEPFPFKHIDSGESATVCSTQPSSPSSYLTYIPQTPSKAGGYEIHLRLHH
jgi:protein OS-9